MASGSGISKEKYRVLTGLCPDPGCQAKLFFPAYESSIECTSCGQRHTQQSLKNVEQVTNPEVALHNMVRNILLGNTTPKKGAESVKVLGLSNYHCKLISPLLTEYGMDKHTGTAKLLQDMGQGSKFDCSHLGDRSFSIDPTLLEVNGYGRDRSGSVKYLSDTLATIKRVNGGQECLVPIHTDGDGHCLVHSVSKAMVGRELFWHALRTNLKDHFTTNCEKYHLLFSEFISEKEWKDIIAECDPEFMAPEWEPVGLRNVHIFGLANVLRRPIILLDSIVGMQSPGDYSGVFLPVLYQPEDCCGKDGSLNKPLCLAWSSPARNHYIALVGIKDRPVPHLPRWMVAKAWGVGADLMEKYIAFDEEGRCAVGGDKCIQDKYIQRLVSAMEKVFTDKHKVHPALVADVHQYVYKSTGMVGVLPEVVLGETVRCVREKRLYRCLTCDAICQFRIILEWLQPGGNLYQMAVQSHGKLRTDKRYSFRLEGLVCTYDSVKDELVPDMNLSKLTLCSWCRGTTMRQVDGMGEVQYANGDRTNVRTTGARCQCGFKHYWDGKQYDNLPEMFPITLEWNGKVVGEKVVWFQYESDPGLNSNVFEVAQGLVQKHFPGEFGSERLVQKVVDTILRQTKNKEEEKKDEIEGAAVKEGDPLLDTSWRSDTPTKIILTGHKHKTLHKEELTKSNAEKDVKKRIGEKAAEQQKRRSLELQRQKDKASASPSTPSGKVRAERASSSEEKGGTPPPRTPPTTTPAAAASAAGKGAKPKDKKVRLSTSDGRQMMLTLEGELTYAALQEKISASIDVSPDRQKIKCGFPPRELLPPATGQEDTPIPLQHGDRITVEITPPPKTEHEPEVCSPTSPSWSTFNSETKDTTADDMLTNMAALQKGDTLDQAIASLSFMATLTGKDLWSSIQTMPHLFSVGGLFYEQVKRDLELVDNKHCKLPALPDKVFRFNAADDRLELCLEPHGHFPVEPGIETRILGTSPAAPNPMLKKIAAEMPKTLGSGGSGVVVNRPMKFPTVYMPFSGEGHSLSDSAAQSQQGPSGCSARMASSSSSSSHVSPKHKSARLLNSNTILESPEEMETEESGVRAGAPLTAREIPAMEGDSSEMPSSGDGSENPSVIFKRVGPGYTILDSQAANEVNEASDRLKSLAARIERSFSSDGELTEPLMEISDEPETRPTPEGSTTGSGRPDPDGSFHQERSDPDGKAIATRHSGSSSNSTCTQILPRQGDGGDATVGPQMAPLDAVEHTDIHIEMSTGEGSSLNNTGVLTCNQPGNTNSGSVNENHLSSSVSKESSESIECHAMSLSNQSNKDGNTGSGAGVCPQSSNETPDQQNMDTDSSDAVKGRSHGDSSEAANTATAITHDAAVDKQESLGSGVKQETMRAAKKECENLPSVSDEACGTGDICGTITASCKRNRAETELEINDTSSEVLMLPSSTVSQKAKHQVTDGRVTPGQADLQVGATESTMDTS